MAAYVHRVRIDALHTIKDLDIDLRPGADEPHRFRHLILTGPNGSGKSSALRFIVEAIEAHRPEGVQWSEPRTAATVVINIPTHRALGFQPVQGITKIEYDRTPGRVSAGLSGFLLQYLVNRKAEQAFAGTDGNHAHETVVKTWFDGFQQTLRWLFEDPGLTLSFDSRRFDFTIHRGDGSAHGLRELADGHGAFLLIFAEITLGIERYVNALIAAGQDADPGTPTGVVILDEIENHLHLRLQEQALPFLTRLFPGFQFITATHSPAVIASVPDAVVYDMVERTATLSAEFVGVRYGTLMTGHFHLPSEFDLDSTTKLAELKRLAAEHRDVGADARLHELADLLSRRSPTLSYEVWRILHEPALGPGLAAAE